MYGPYFPRQLIAVVLLALASCYAAAADWERVQTADNQVLALQGIALNRTLNENFYLAAFYLQRPSADGSTFYDATQARRLHLRVLADRIYAAGINRHFRDLILINNPRDELTREAASIQRFGSLFKLGLLHGDEIFIDYRPGKNTSVMVNAVKIAEFPPRMFDFVLRGLIGETPPGQQFKTQLTGSNNNDRHTLIAQFDATLVNEERLKVYAGVESSAPAPAQVVAPVAVAAKPAEKPPLEKVADATKPTITKPTPVVETKPKVAEKPVEHTVDKPNETKPEPQHTTPEKPVVVASTKPAVIKAPPPPSAEQIEQWLMDYQQLINEKFAGAVVYPKREMKRKYGISQMARVKADIMLRLFLDKGGDVNAAWLQKRSGETIIDQAALALVDSVAPFPPMRDALPDSAYEFFVELHYDPDK